ncbi:MAG: hypothetical protein GC189_08155 [Alphaproteobacteria bacterium]|nr:hypothetical protein [Alphaproteobacteria bacterium]
MAVRLGVGAALLAIAAACAPVNAGASDDGWRDIELTVRAVRLDEEDSSVSRVGALTFRGGVELSSEDRAFGGLSALEVDENGALLAVTDEGGWFAAQLDLNDAGRLVGVSAPRMGALRDGEGRPFRTKAESDSEGLAQLPDGRYAVSFERSQSVLIYDLAQFGAAAPGRAGPQLSGTAALDPNEGPEALGILQDGRLLIGAERAGGATTPIWLVPPDATEAAPRFQASLDFGFGLVAFDLAPNGDMIALQRFYAPVVGVRIRVVRILAADLARDAGALPLTTLAELAAPLTLDNFEGVAAVANANGGVRLYLVSDNNFSPRQRTLLMAFDWTP